MKLFVSYVDFAKHFGSDCGTERAIVDHEQSVDSGGCAAITDYDLLARHLNREPSTIETAAFRMAFARAYHEQMLAYLYGEAVRT